jgi:hypothetical protein
MSRNARESPRKQRVYGEDPGGSPRSIGPSLSSGFRSRQNAISPASGIRSAPGALRPPAPLVLPRLPAYRESLDSEAVTTEIGEPDPSLLALSRQAPPPAPDPPAAEPEPRRGGGYSRLAWFVLGAFVGGTSVWAVSTDLKADVFRARTWVASTLRSVRAHAHPGEDVHPASPPTPSAELAAPPGPVIPTVDVSQLPKVREEQVQPALTTPAPSPLAPGAPALPHAPGPR